MTDARMISIQTFQFKSPEDGDMMPVEIDRVVFVSSVGDIIEVHAEVSEKSKKHWLTCRHAGSARKFVKNGEHVGATQIGFVTVHVYMERGD